MESLTMSLHTKMNAAEEQKRGGKEEEKAYGGTQKDITVPAPRGVETSKGGVKERLVVGSATLFIRG